MPALRITPSCSHVCVRTARLRRQRLEAELASKGATLEERQRAEAQLAARRAELQSCVAEVEREERERLALEQRIRAMESKAGGRGARAKVHCKACGECSTLRFHLVPTTLRLLLPTRPLNRSSILCT